MLQFTFSKPWHNSYRLGPFTAGQPGPTRGCHVHRAGSLLRKSSSIGLTTMAKRSHQELKLQCDKWRRLARLGGTGRPGGNGAAKLPAIYHQYLRHFKSRSGSRALQPIA